jgi:hypothetical protein
MTCSPPNLSILTSHLSYPLLLELGSINIVKSLVRKQSKYAVKHKYIFLDIIQHHLSDDMFIFFMPGRSTMEAIFLIRQLMKRHREQKDLHMIFIDLEKTYDKIPRNIMWWAL